MIFTVRLFYSKIVGDAEQDPLLDASDQVKYSSVALRKALNKLSPTLGIVAVQFLFLALRAHGMPLSQGHEAYSISQIQGALNDIFGNVTPVFIRGLKSVLASSTE